jgi:hypothetical protein
MGHSTTILQISKWYMKLAVGLILGGRVINAKFLHKKIIEEDNEFREDSDTNHTMGTAEKTVHLLTVDAKGSPHSFKKRKDATRTGHKNYWKKK